ncbi:hypothetical protein OF83DRAFT_1134140 [Amylostereum chailletii]|nr:hypothetical protein OF83DRAFT_1134140 [Amylostereum chailletii]
MSAYGPSAVRPSRPPLSSTLWALLRSEPASGKPSSPFTHVTLHHLTLPTAQSLSGLVDYTHSVFAAEVAAGLTYPQEVSPGEEYTLQAFEGYVWSADVIVAIGGSGDVSGVTDGAEVSGGVEEASKGRSWEESLVGFYYVKPNYPGRSSHICNAGFVIPPQHRRFGYGKILGRSYLHYGPSLGYKASVFNLVYVSNVGSMRIWDGLGFTRAGLIPRAGRLKKADGSGEEWTDAVVFYKSFLGEEDWAKSI